MELPENQINKCEYTGTINILVGRHKPYIVDCDDEDFVINLKNEMGTQFSIILTQYQLDSMINEYKQQYD